MSQFSAFKFVNPFLLFSFLKSPWDGGMETRQPAWENAPSQMTSPPTDMMFGLVLL